MVWARKAEMSVANDARATVLARLKGRLERLAVLVGQQLVSKPADHAPEAGATERPEIAHQGTRDRRPQTRRRA